MPCRVLLRNGCVSTLALWLPYRLPGGVDRGRWLPRRLVLPFVGRNQRMSGGELLPGQCSRAHSVLIGELLPFEFGNCGSVPWRFLLQGPGLDRVVPCRELLLGGYPCPCRVRAGKLLSCGIECFHALSLWLLLSDARCQEDVCPREYLRGRFGGGSAMSGRILLRDHSSCCAMPCGQLLRGWGHQLHRVRRRRVLPGRFFSRRPVRCWLSVCGSDVL